MKKVKGKATWARRLGVQIRHYTPEPDGKDPFNEAQNRRYSILIFSNKKKKA